MKRPIEFRVWDKRRKKYISTRDIIIRCNGEIAGVHGGLGSVEEWVLEQYIGLNDRKCNKIFEGDIVTISHYHPEEVLYLVIVKDIRRIPEEFYDSNFNWSEVKGNINENLGIKK